MNVSQKGLDLIKEFEGLRLKAYLDQVGVPTIGYGTITYKNGVKVKMGDVITKEQAEDELRSYVMRSVPAMLNYIKRELNQNQFDALVSFVYNLGLGALAQSTLLKKLNVNPCDPTIRQEFEKWNKGRVNGVLTPLEGLTKRRKKEANLFFS